MIDDLSNIEKLYPAEPTEKNAKLYGELFSKYQKFDK